jgi:hypothetical protein
VISSLAKWLENLIFAILTPFGVWPRDHYMPLQKSTRVPASNAKVSSWLEPLLYLVDQITSCVFPHTSKQDSQHVAVLISKQAVSYRTCGDTCCPGVSTPKTRCLAYLSITNHISWRNATVSTILTLLKSQHRSSPLSPHIMKDGRPTLSWRWKDFMTLMTAWLSITNQLWTQILKYEA